MAMSPSLDITFPQKAQEVFASLNPAEVITLPNFLDNGDENAAPDVLLDMGRFSL